MQHHQSKMRSNISKRFTSSSTDLQYHHQVLKRDEKILEFFSHDTSRYSKYTFKKVRISKGKESIIYIYIDFKHFQEEDDSLKFWRKY